MSNEDLEPHLSDAFLWDPGMANAKTFWEDAPAAERQVAAADQGYLMDEIGGVSWERSGLLQRLRRRTRLDAS
jgi:hypothetical protein